MSYGKFSQDGYEYIITNPATPRPWGNFLTNEVYGSVISATGSGYSFFKDSRTDRLSWFLGPNLYKDKPGKYVFIHDHDKQEGWSASWSPIRAKFDSYECHVGLGYQTIKQSRIGIESEVTYFVPRQESCEVWLVKVRNKSKEQRSLSVFGYMEWWIGSTEYINFYNISLLWNRVAYDKKLNAILARKTAYYVEFNIKESPAVGFFTTSENPAGWDCRKAAFLGNNNTEENPLGALNGVCNNSLCDGEEAVGVLQNKLSLKPGEEKTLVFVLGQTIGEADAAKIIKKYQDVATAEKELAEVKKVWRSRIDDNVKIETPDNEFNTMMNIWIKYQLYICNLWSRSPSFYHEGQGGRGYRDSCQDAEGILAIDVEHARKKILKIASLTRRDGTVAPGWSDTYGPFPNRPFKDHPTWLASTISAYIKETGDKQILNRSVPWLKDKWGEGGTQITKWNQPAVEDGAGTLFDHLLAMLNCTYNDTSVHGIPRVGEADWNDALDMAGKRQIGESVWLGMALVRSLKLLAEMADQIGKNDISKDLRQKAETMAKRLNKDGWDEAGGYYIAGYNDDLVPFGSSRSNEGKIFLNSQSWAILAGIVTPDRLTKILKASDKLLGGRHGYALLAPAYTKFDPGLGRIAMFSKGTKENAAVFCHAQTFMLAALCQAGLGNKAYEEMCKIMPNKQKDIEVYKVEPYVYAEYLIGPEHPYAYGEGSFTWLTGTAGWTFLVATEWVLGAARDWEGLRIMPNLPSKWKKCKITRPFRGATYEIEIENPDGVEGGRAEISVDGKKIDGNLVPAHADGKTHQVKVILKK